MAIQFVLPFPIKPYPLQFIVRDGKRIWAERMTYQYKCFHCGTTWQSTVWYSMPHQLLCEDCWWQGFMVKGGLVC